MIHGIKRTHFPAGETPKFGYSNKPEKAHRRGRGGGMASRSQRTRGMETPYATDQISALVLHPIISAGFVAMSALSLEPATLGVALSPFLVLNVVLVGLWGYISWKDPAAEGGCSLRKKNNDTPHYCSTCRKTVRGFDHHCSWLNTCISARNYAHFFFLGVTGSLLYLYMSAMGVVVLLLSGEDGQRDAFGSLTAARIAWGVFIAVAGWIAVSFVALAGFHTYLLVLGLGTYDWVVLQNQRRQEKLSAHRTREAGGGGSRGRCCGGGGGHVRQSPIPTASVGAVGVSTRPGGRPLSDSAGAGETKGRWGGTGMGVGVTPTRSRGLSREGDAGGNGSGTRADGGEGGGGALSIAKDP
ncbi:unnamed protein product [Pylaiella littoralis]